MKKRLMACLMAVCMFTTVLAPVNGTFATEVIEETIAPTEAPTSAPTEAPKPTEAPATEAPKPTEAPATEAPVQAVSEVEETEKPTEAPATEAPATEAPATEAPATEAPATEAPATEVPATETPATEVPATEVPATEAPATEVPVTEAPTDVPATEVPTEEPTEEPTEVPGTEVPTEEPTVEPTVEPTIPVPETELSIAAAANAAYAFANEDTISVAVTISGGIAPYSLTLKVNGADMQSWTDIAEAGEYAVSYAPTEFGVHKFEIIVTDALGVSKAGGFEVPVAVREEERESDWKRDFRDVELTGDWREDLIAIAKTQIGYKESERNFRIDDEGKKQGYTRYGDWYGSSYEEWCAMFVSFCLNYAEVPENYFPREANCARWKEQLQWKGAYEDDEYEYEPKPGDLIFFNWQSDYDDTHKRENKPQHIGIVEKVTDDKVYTIEGNSAGAVRRQDYDRDSIVIVGYGNTEKLMDRAGLIPGEEIECAFVGAKAYTKNDGINMRSDATTASEVVVKIETADAEMTILGAKQTGEMIWYQVQYGEYVGYIRGDLIEIAENLIPSEPEATAEPSVEPTAVPDATVAPEVTVAPEATIEPEETMGVPVDATIEPTVEPTPAPTEEPVVITGVTVTENVNIREQPTTDSERVTYISAAGEEVIITGSGEVNGELWYAVIYGEYKGYIRADLIAVQEQPTAEPSVEPTVEPTAEPSVEPSVEPTVEPSVEPDTVCECADAEGNRACAEDCACDCHIEDLPTIEDELLCVCNDAEGNRICAEDCACECHAAEETVCVCYDAEGNLICGEGCECACHEVEDPEVEAPAEIVYLPWQNGVVETVMSYAVEGAVHYSWQRGMVNENGEMVWKELATTNHTEVLLTTMFDDLAYSYRCVATVEDGTQVISNEITLIDAELVQWMNEAEVTEEMLARAMNAKSLDSMVIEDEVVFYVRTGEVYARIDKDTGYMIDERTGLVIAVVDLENGLIYPIVTESADDE